ncbi:hypothetical protein C8J57DRAFT_1577112 [Mycena rebaudengoi]|nr:hypothetical protein C8J57DRAFT_1577112 [Mycena rebaudengoi]
MVVVRSSGRLPRDLQQWWLASEATNKYCMTDNLQLNNRPLITDNAIAAEQLLFAFGLYNEHLEVDGQQLLDAVCGVGFVDNSPSPVQPGVKRTSVGKPFVAANANEPNTKNDNDKKEGGVLYFAARSILIFMGLVGNLVNDASRRTFLAVIIWSLGSAKLSRGKSHLAETAIIDSHVTNLLPLGHTQPPPASSTLKDPSPRPSPNSPVTEEERMGGGGGEGSKGAETKERASASRSSRAKSLLGRLRVVFIRHHLS